MSLRKRSERSSGRDPTYVLSVRVTEIRRDRGDKAIGSLQLRVKRVSLPASLVSGVERVIPDSSIKSSEVVTTTEWAFLEGSALRDLRAMGLNLSSLRTCS